MISLFLDCFLQNCECFHLARAQPIGVEAAQLLAHEKLFEQRFALARDVRLRARKHRDVFSRPNGRAPVRRLFIQTEPPAPPLFFQTGFPACVALPTGLVGKLKVEGDDQFFLSS